MPIEDVFTIQGRGTVVTGKVEQGVVKVGEEVEIVGLRPTAKTVCTGVEMFRKLLDQGQAGDNIGALLRGTKKEEVERGQVLCKPGLDHAPHQLRGQRLRPDQGRGRAPQAVLQQLPAAVLLPDHRRDRFHHPGRGHRDGHARRQHRDDRGAAASPSPWTRVCASPSARAAAPSVPAGSPRSSSSGRQEPCGRRPVVSFGAAGASTFDTSGDHMAVLSPGRVPWLTATSRRSASA